MQNNILYGNGEGGGGWVGVGGLLVPERVYEKIQGLIFFNIAWNSYWKRGHNKHLKMECAKKDTGLSNFKAVNHFYVNSWN